MSASRLAQATLVMPETTFRDVDSVRIILRPLLHETGRNPQTRIEVEDVETAVELVGMGLADSVITKGAARSSCPGSLRTLAGCPCAHVSTTPSRSCTDGRRSSRRLPG